MFCFFTSLLRISDNLPHALPASSPCLAVSRSFGDIGLKEPHHIVVVTPEIKITPVGASDWGVVLACDGVWDVLSEQHVVDIMIAHRTDAKKAASEIAKAALAAGSTDNVSVVAVVFDWQESVITALTKPAVSIQATRAVPSSDDDDDMFKAH